MKVLAVLSLFLALTAPALGRSLSQAAAPAGASGLSVGAPAPAGPSGPLNDTDILNFALNLEYLEAEFYSCAATGSPLPASLRGGGPPSTGCQMAKLSGPIQAFAQEIAKNEMQHVIDLRTALGAAAVPLPQLNVGTVFEDIANAALKGTVTPAFSPYANDILFLLGAFIFEDVGVTAYEGAVGVIQSVPYLQTAAKIMAVEAYQSGIIRAFLYQENPVNNADWPYQPSITDVATAISNLRAGASNAQDDEGIVTNGTVTLVPVNSDSLVYARNPTQVIDVVTLGKGQAGGGFFPNGLNGYFSASAA